MAAKQASEREGDRATVVDSTKTNGKEANVGT